MPNPPRTLRAGDISAAFERVPDFFALHSTRRAGSAPLHPPGAPVAVVNDGPDNEYSVYQGKPDEAVATGPVYSAGPQGPLAIPTGRVLVRLQRGLKPGSRRRDFAAAGFAIETTLAYAPDSAWLKPKRGGVAEALDGLVALEKLPGVEHVEAQVLLARDFKILS